jgi:thiol-disulfide isomerase/thioredoxin
MSYLFEDNNRRVDTLLFNYIKLNPDSYVGLWKLVERFASQGHSVIRKQTLLEFSTKIKTCPVWKTLKVDFDNEKIVEGEKFPDVNLKTFDLVNTKLVLPKSKYTLVDFWFARCRPCLDTIPVLKQLYADYGKKGLCIISISVDETKNVPIWQSRVKEHGMLWTQYLEENNFRKNELGVKMYPTFILLDTQGKIIWKAFDLHDLDKFLKEHI